MRLLVCGGRNFDDRALMDWALDPYLPMPTTELLVIEGGARGADTMAREWAQKHGVTVMEFPANWEFFGKAAGPVRNNTMLRWGAPDVVVALPGGNGTAHVVRQARAAGIATVVIDPRVFCGAP